MHFELCWAMKDSVGCSPSNLGNERLHSSAALDAFELGQPCHVECDVIVLQMQPSKGTATELQMTSEAF